MPFWHGDTGGRPAEFGEQIGRMTRELLQMPRTVAFAKLVEEHSLDQNAAENLMRYLEEQATATERVPSDEDVLIERCRDELGDWRICVLTPIRYSRARSVVHGGNVEAARRTRHRSGVACGRMTDSCCACRRTKSRWTRRG